MSELQHESIDRQLQENMGALSPRAKLLSPEEIIKPNASMNAAFAKFFAGLWNAPMVFAPYVAAGYGETANALLAFHEQIATNLELVKMRVRPPHRRLDVLVQFVQRARFDLDASPDQRPEIKKRDLELVKPFTNWNRTNALGIFNRIGDEFCSTLQASSQCRPGHEGDNC